MVMSNHGSVVRQVVLPLGAETMTVTTMRAVRLGDPRLGPERAVTGVAADTIAVMVVTTTTVEDSRTITAVQPHPVPRHGIRRLFPAPSPAPQAVTVALQAFPDMVAMGHLRACPPLPLQAVLLLQALLPGISPRSSSNMRMLHRPLLLRAPLRLRPRAINLRRHLQVPKVTDAAFLARVFMVFN